MTFKNNPQSGLSICVVGAGPSGLSAAKTFLQAGLDVTCFDGSPHIGGHWVIDNPTGRSSAYRSLRTNTTKKMSRFSDFDWPDDWPEFPGFDQVREWLESYVDHFGFRRHIQLSTEVVKAEPLETGGWQISLRGTDGADRVERFDALVAASGTYWDRKMPQWPGHFEGQIIHAQDYRSPDALVVADKHVMVVGIGNTGCELACELSGSTAASVSLSARSGTWILPKTVDGVPASESVPMTHPTDPVPGALVELSEKQRDNAVMVMASAAIKEHHSKRMQRFEAHGLPSAPEHPFLKRPTISQDLLACLESGQLRAKPDIARLDGDAVIFADGARLDMDVLICATGYHLSYPYLAADIADTRADDLDLFCGIMPSDRRDLFYIGVGRPFGAFWPIAEAQAQFVAALLAGDYVLPAQEEIVRRTVPTLNRPAITPGLYGLALREELDRGRKRQ
ncbi:flavin-containing monooxygenase [Parasphingorhabdus sp.]|jgi:cation diffusion facilitator CzcD-associated flavoprotein CzcO|uniref:flavin-containing monooxygenase n=1 Tax=Parasphingorhabdus sp. TaxID=2709688 RepID=UPI003D2A70ED